MHKKMKTSSEGVCEDMNMELMNTLNPLANLRARVCSNLQIQPEDPMEESLHYYMGDDDEEKYPGIDELFNKQNLSA